MLNSLFTPIYDSTSTLTAAAFLAILGSALVLGALLGAGSKFLDTQAVNGRQNARSKYGVKKKGAAPAKK